MKGIVIRYLNKVCTKYEIRTLDSLGGQGHKVKKTLESIERYCHKNCLVKRTAHIKHGSPITHH